MASKTLDFIRKVFVGDRVPENAYSSISGFPAAGVIGAGVYGLDVGRGMKVPGLAEYFELEQDLTSRFIDYESFDEIPELSTSLDIFADDATQPDPLTGKTISVECDDEIIKSRLEHLFDKNLRIDEDIWEIARTTCKYGNDFEEMIVKEGEGVVDLIHLPPPSVRRIEDMRGTLLGFLQDLNGQFRVTTDEFFQRLQNRDKEHEIVEEGYKQGKHVSRVIEDWECVHFRLRGKQRRAQYGVSVLESARWIVKRLILLEDSMIVYRLTRAPERFAFFIDVGDMPPNEAKAELHKIKNDYKKKKMIDPHTGKLDAKYNPLSSDEDFFIATRKGQDSTRIETLGGFSYQGIDDINYFRDKLYAALKVPKDYLNFTEPGLAKANLSQEDVRFCRSVLRVQRELRNGLKKIGRVHLAAFEINPEATEWDISMTVPSSVFEMATYEVKNAQLDLAGRYDAFASKRWIMKNILEFSDEDIDLMDKEMGGEAGAAAGVDLPPEGKQPKAGKGESVDNENRWPYGTNAGVREHEKILEDNVDKLMQNDKLFSARMGQLKGLMQEIKDAMRRRR